MASTSKISTVSYQARPLYRTETLLPHIPEPTISFPIHPIFSFENFSTDTDPSTDEDLKYPELACRLASLLLEAALPLCHSILVAGKLAEIFPEPLIALHPDQRARTQARISEASSGIDLRVGDTQKGADGQTEAYPKTTFTDLPGCRSTIVIDYKPVQQVLAAKRDGDTIAYLWNSLLLARLLIHEFMHAIAYAARPVPMNGDSHGITLMGNGFVGSSRTCEIGHISENYLFGGTFVSRTVEDMEPFYRNSDGSASAIVSGENVLILKADYPNPDDLRAYKHLPRRGPSLKPEYADWNIPLDWLHSLFQQDFWDAALVGSHDNTFLWPPKSTGAVQISQEFDLNGVESMQCLLDYAGILWMDGNRFRVMSDGSIVPNDRPSPRPVSPPTRPAAPPTRPFSPPTRPGASGTRPLGSSASVLTAGSSSRFSSHSVKAAWKKWRAKSPKEAKRRHTLAGKVG